MWKPLPGRTTTRATVSAPAAPGTTLVSSWYSSSAPAAGPPRAAPAPPIAPWSPITPLAAGPPVTAPPGLAGSLVGAALFFDGFDLLHAVVMAAIATTEIRARDAARRIRAL